MIIAIAVGCVLALLAYHLLVPYWRRKVLKEPVWRPAVNPWAVYPAKKGELVWSEGDHEEVIVTAARPLVSALLAGIGSKVTAWFMVADLSFFLVFFVTFLVLLPFGIISALRLFKEKKRLATIRGAFEYEFKMKHLNALYGADLLDYSDVSQHELKIFYPG